MSSFYGGKQGRTYNIVQRYDSVADMTEAFSGGGAYTDANYGQYVIIDTVYSTGRSNLENGLLYRRGFDYNDSPSNYPKPKETDFKNNDNTTDMEAFRKAWQAWVVNPGAGAIYVGQILGPEGRSPKIQVQQWDQFEEQIDSGDYSGDYNQITMVRPSGKTTDDTKVGYVNLKDQHGDIVGAYIAFSLPYTVFQAKVTNSDAYATAGVVEDEDTTNHPFWYKWNFTIPKGKHGQDITSFTKETGEDIGSGVDADENPIVSEDQYITYTTTNYDESADGTVTEHLGRWPWRVINEITPVNKTRILKTWESGISYSIGDLVQIQDDIYQVCIRAGQINIANLPSFKPDGQLAPYQLGYESQSGESKWRVVKIPDTAPAYQLDVDYKAGNNDIIPGLRNIDYFTVDENGQMYVFYSDSNIPYYLTSLNTIEYIAFNQDTGNLEVKYYGITVPYTFDIHAVKSLQYKNLKNINLQQYFAVNYYGEEDNSERVISGYFNNILAIQRYGDTILALYSDPEYRRGIENDPNTLVNRDFFKLPWYDKVNDVHYDDLVWVNLGSSLVSQYHVQGEYTLNDLKTTLKDGFDEDFPERVGWLVTIVDDNNNRHIYAFDYNDKTTSGSHTLYDGTASHWYEVMSLAASAVDPNLSIVASDTTPTSLLDHGYWFVVSYGHDNV